MKEVRKEFERELIERIDQGMRIFAVMDGALFDNLPRELEELGFPSRSLFTDKSSPEQRILGPRLVALDRRLRSPVLAWDPPEDVSDEELRLWANRAARDVASAVEAGDESGGGTVAPLFEVADPRSRAADLVDFHPNAERTVFWMGKYLHSDELVDHLRTLYRVRIETSEDAKGDVGSDSYSAMFRHADADVMAQVTPVLTPAQVERLLGPAAVLCYYSGRFGGMGTIRQISANSWEI